MTDDTALIAVEDPRDEQVQLLLRQHLAFAADHSPPEQVFALDVDGLLDPAVTLYGIREDGVLVGLGALKRLAPGHGEVKSMHVAAEARGRGLGRTMLSHLIAEARAVGLLRLSLETGPVAMPSFDAARRIYAEAGFVSCGPFSHYVASEWSMFMTLDLTAS